MGFANLPIVPEAPYAEGPHCDRALDTLFTASARLDNRDELCERFGLARAERARVADEHLAWLAWEEWGERAPEHLLGDWAFAAWDGRRRQLLLARDPLGNTALYFFHQGPLFAFCSDPEGLLALPVLARRTNEAWLASFLAYFPLAPEGDTCWQDVKALLPGFSLAVSAMGSVSRRYWDLPDLPPFTGLGEDEVVGLFLERYRGAVRTRLRSRQGIGATLSGGLDSSSVTALAAQELQKTGGRLLAFTSVPRFPAAAMRGVLSDEGPLASLVAGRFPNLEHCALDAAAISPVEGIMRSLETFRSPQHAARNEFWIMALLEAARNRSLGVLLTGQLGNGGISWDGGGDRIFHLFASGRWDEGLKAMAGWQGQHGRSWFAALAHGLLLPLCRPYLPRRNPLGPVPGGLQAGVAARLGLPQEMAATRHARTSRRPLPPREDRRRTLLVNGAVACPAWHAAGAAFGLEVRDPTADIRLVEFCLRVPEEHNVRNGAGRLLLRHAMEGILPPVVQWNTLYGRQGADLVQRLQHHRDETGATLARFGRDEAVSGFLDLPALERTWGELQDGREPRRAEEAAASLMRGLMAGAFLEREARGSGSGPPSGTSRSGPSSGP